MFIYNVNMNAVSTSAAGTYSLGIIPGANRSLMIIEMDFEGQGTTSGTGTYGIYRNTTTTVGSASGATISQVDSTAVSLTPSFSAGTGGWTTPPTLNTLIHMFGLNANGQRYFWRANPNLNNAIVISGSSTAGNGGIAMGPVASTQAANIIGRIMIAEL